MIRRIDGSFLVETDDAADMVLGDVMTRNIDGTFAIETDDAAEVVLRDGLTRILMVHLP